MVRPGPLRSLASRMILSVFSAALISSLVVTWTSSRSTESFLRSNIEEHFPELLQTSRQRLALWFAQRELDIVTFAASETVEALVRRPQERTRAAADRYLGYVLDAFPQYSALFVRKLLAKHGVTVSRIATGVPMGGASRLGVTSAMP